MMKALHTAGTGMQVQQLTVDVIANNLANANTSGFKRSQIDFQDLLYQNMQRPGMETWRGVVSPTGLQIGSGARAASTTKVFTQGTLNDTGRDLDMAIQGDGFFQVTMPDGSTAYTRDGAFRIDATGNIVNTDGLKVTPGIAVPTTVTTIAVGKDGTVTGTTADSPPVTSTLGQITLARFPNPAGLSSEGGNTYRETASSGAPIVTTATQNGAGQIVQKSLEGSNVEVVTELVNLITAQRSYEVASRAIKTGDDMLALVNNLTH
jgi:flagellar basal-body rod protein FlgG